MGLRAISKSVQAINGVINIIGDKSISHRALIIGAQAIGITKIYGISNCQDVLCTKNILNILGIKIEYDIKEDVVNVYGVGTAGIRQPNDIMNMSGSGTTLRLIMGLLSSYKFVSFFTGDSSLRNRPVDRIIEPLYLTGARFISNKKSLPICMIGSDENIPINYTMKFPSAQVKSAILFSALSTAGISTIIEPFSSRNHTELMLRYFGADVNVESSKDTEGNIITLRGQVDFRAKNINVPSDFSAAAFFIAAALMLKNSEILIKNVLINSTRIGFYQMLLNMGADIVFLNRKILSGEEVADILVRSSELSGINISSDVAPSMIDEYPIMAVIAAYADGITVMNGLSELKIKESNRLKAISSELNKCGISIEIESDNLTIFGTNNKIKGGAYIKTFFDHRIAMAFLVLGMVSTDFIEIDNISCINKSFPNFIEIFNKCGANIKLL